MFRFYMLLINVLCCDAVLYCMGSIIRTINMGTIGVRLYQHFMTARTSYVIGLPHNVFFWHDIIHVTMYFLMSYDVIYLWFMLSMLSIYAHRYDAILYCMGTIDIRQYQYNDIRRYIQQCVIACLGIGGVHMYHHSRQVGVGLRYCDTYQLRLCVRSVVVITSSCNCRTESW